jgi:hypothetical protein
MTTHKHDIYALSADKLSKNIKAIGRTGKAFDALVHSTGVALIIESMPHSAGGHLNADPVVAFMRALPPGASRNRVVAWLEKYSNIRVTTKVNEDKSLTFKAKLVKASEDGYAEANPVAAHDNPYWLAFSEGAAVPVTFTQKDFDRMLAALIRRADAAKEAGTFDLPAMDVAVLDNVRKLSDAVHKRMEGMKPQQAKASTMDAAAKRGLAA